jgi:hypothetical protein
MKVLNRLGYLPKYDKMGIKLASSARLLILVYGAQRIEYRIPAGVAISTANLADSYTVFMPIFGAFVDIVCKNGR